MKLKSIARLPLLICVAVVGTVGLLQALTNHFPGFQVLQRLEWMTYDWRVQQANKFSPPVAGHLGFVQISEDTIALFSDGALGTNYQFGLYWPRRIYGQVVRELGAQGAKAVGLDVLFSDRRFDHPPSDGPDGPIPSDVFFALQMKQAGNVVLGAAEDVTPPPLFMSNAYALGDISNERDADGVLRRVKAFHDYRIWHQVIKKEARLNNWKLERATVQSNLVIIPSPTGDQVKISLNDDGYFDPSEVTHVRSPDGFVRLQKAYEDLRVWHMGIVLAAMELHLDLSKPLLDLKNHRLVLAGTNGVNRIIPVDEKGQFLVDWSLRQQDPRLTTDAFETLVANDILRQRGSNITDRFRGKLVMVGSTASGNDLTDRGATPLEKDTFLTSNHWNVINSMLANRFILQSSPLMEQLLIGLMGLVAAVFNWRWRAMWASAFVALLCVTYVALGSFLFISHRNWIPLVMPVGGSLLVHFALTTYRVVFEQNERRRIKNVFAKIVSPHVVHELLKAEKLPLGGARRKITVFFADVRGFTEMTDVSHARAEGYVREHQLGDKEAEAYFDAQSQEVLRQVNLYLGLVADIIKKHEGTLDKYIGDCVMAFWGAPAPNERHALACVRAAIDAQRAIFALNQQQAAENRRREGENRTRAEAGLPPLEMLPLLSLGSGINTGVVTVGLMGSEAHGMNYTVFGREVNLASRLEGVSGRERIIIGEATFLELLQDDPELASTCIELPPERIKGFRTAVKNFEVPWKPSKPGVDKESAAGTVAIS